MVFKAGHLAKMGPLKKLGKQWHPIAKLVCNLVDLAVTAISRLYSEETRYPVFGHFKCVEGLHPCEFEKLCPVLNHKYEPSDLSRKCTDFEKHRPFPWHFAHP